MLAGQCIAPISKVSARDLLEELILSDSRFSHYPDPTIYDARYMADKLRDERGWIVDAGYLQHVWIELWKHGELKKGE